MKSPEYWQKRLEALNEAQLNKGEAYANRAEVEYKKAMVKIQKDVDAWYNRLAKNNDVSVAGARKLLSKNELQEFKWTVEDYIKAGRENALDQRWMKQLENASAKVHISRLEAIQTQMRQHIETLSASKQAGTKQLLGGIYKDGYYKTIFELQKGIGLGASFAKLDDRQLEMLLSRPWAPDGNIFSGRIWKDKVKLISELDTTLVQSLIRGDTSEDMIKAFAKHMGVSERDARRLIMTEAAYFSGQATLDGYNEISVKEYQFLATLDFKTSTVCRDMDLKIFLVSEARAGVNYPPLHAHCRSTTIPHYEDNIIERIARGADARTYNVPGDMNYAQWAERYAEDAKRPPKLTPPEKAVSDVEPLPTVPEKLYDEKGETLPKLASLGDMDLDSLIPDVPRKLGDIDPVDTKAITLYIDKTEKAISKATEEHAVAITPKGEVFHVKGDARNVDIAKIGSEKLKGSTVTHNHPNSLGDLGGSLSDGDAMWFEKLEMKELRAVDSASMHRMLKTLDSPLVPNITETLIDQATSNAIGKMTVADALSAVDMKHLTMVELALLVKGLTYEKVDWDGEDIEGSE